jgi:hypothetical protein
VTWFREEGGGLRKVSDGDEETAGMGGRGVGGGWRKTN